MSAIPKAPKPAAPADRQRNASVDVSYARSVALNARQSGAFLIMRRGGIHVRLFCGIKRKRMPARGHMKEHQSVLSRYYVRESQTAFRKVPVQIGLIKTLSSQTPKRPGKRLVPHVGKTAPARRAKVVHLHPPGDVIVNAVHVQWLHHVKASGRR